MVTEQINSVEASLQRMSAKLTGMPVQEVLITRLILFLAHDIAMMLERQIRPYGLGEGEFRVLAALFSQPGGTANPGELCTRATQSPANMSRISDALVSRELITREHSCLDRRKSVLSLTPKGEELVRNLLPNLHGPLRQVCAQYSAAELQELVELLKRLALGLDAVIATVAVEPEDAEGGA